MTEKRRMRIAELSRESGVSRETIHYYLREGLLPKPHKTGKTAALYDETHLERLRLIRRLRDEKYLPVAVIRRMLASAGERAKEPDLATLADVIAIDPSARREHDELGGPDDESVRVAFELGLLGPRRALAAEGPFDASELRVLSAVSEALALDGDARALTLADLKACARELSELVEREAGLFFELVLESGDVARSVQALRAGRATVARFVQAYRDLMLRRVVDEITEAAARGQHLLGAARTLPLGAERAEALGIGQRSRELRRRAAAGDPAAANDLVWHLFVVGNASELLEFSADFLALLRPRAELLIEHRRRALAEPAPALDAALARAQPFPLGQILMAERALARLVSSGPSSERGFLDEAVPALHQLSTASPERDADPLASAYAFLRRGLIALALPRALGARIGGAADLERAVETLLTVPGRIDPASRAVIEGNARLALGRVLLAEGRDAAKTQLERAHAIDPEGPIGSAAAALLVA